MSFWEQLFSIMVYNEAIVNQTLELVKKKDIPPEKITEQSRVLSLQLGIFLNECRRVGVKKTTENIVFKKYTVWIEKLEEARNGNANNKRKRD